jgi:hypothetical protein
MLLPSMPRNVLAKQRGVGLTRHAQRAAERPPPLREVEASRIAMHGCTAAR